MSGSAAEVSGARPAKRRTRLMLGLALGVGIATIGAVVAVATRHDNAAGEGDDQTAQVAQPALPQQLPPPPRPLPASRATPAPQTPPPPQVPPPEVTPQQIAPLQETVQGSQAPPPSQAPAPVINPPPSAPRRSTAPATVSITIQSTPSGAQVFVGKENTARGTTPCVVELDPAAEHVEIRAVRAGYKPTKRTVRPSNASKLAFALEKLTEFPATNVKPEPSAAGQEDSDNTMDPFKKKKGAQ